MVKGTHRGSAEDGGAETSTRATAPRQQPPHGVGKRWRQCPSLTPRRSPSLRARQSPSAIALFLSKKGKGKHVRREASALTSARRVPNPTQRNVVFTLAELRHITKNFSDDLLLGNGAFGKVYKGVLTNGDTIAVKRFASTIIGLQDVQYENEVQHLMRLKHPNIVQLVGYCLETDTKLVWYNGTLVRAEETERLLCLEYLQKGSLRGHLSDESSGLDWNTRYKIIEGICYGLRYLHEEWQATPIIHMDLKPENILLDDNMVPKIADFGLSRLFGEEQTRTRTTSCKGTPGYMAPEYLENGVITKKFDIFSLGVIIIEIITGRRDYPTDETHATSQQYIETVFNNWRHRRKPQGYPSQDIDYQQIIKCIQIGLFCVQFDWLKRPTIIQIIKMLEESNEAYKNEREVLEEVEKAMLRQFNAPAAPPRNQQPRYQLMLLNHLKPVYTMTKLESHDGTALKVAIVEKLGNNLRKIVRHGPLSSVTVEVVVLHGNFNARNEESWSPEEFKKHIVSTKNAHLLTGNLALKLNGGEAVLENAIFTDNSSFTSTKMFRLGLRLVNSSGERVLEGVTKPFRVKDGRVEGFEKHYPPMLEDEVWRLKKIGINGAYHQALSDNGIGSVQEFLRAYMKDEQRLIKIFNKMPQSTWKSIIEHAMTCKVGDSLYLYEVREKDAGLFFDEIYQLVGAKFGDCYKPIDQLNEIEKNLVESLKQGAYQSIDGLHNKYKIVDNYIVPNKYKIVDNYVVI